MIEAIRKIIAFSGKEKLFIPYARLQGTVLGVFKALLWFFTEYLGVITKGRMMYSVPSVASRSERVRGG